MNRTPDAESATTEVMHPRERVDYWAHLIDSYHGRLGYRFPSRSDFRGRALRRRTDLYQLVGWESDAVTYCRDRRHIRTAPDEDYRLVLATTGQVLLRQDGEGGSLPPGTCALVTIDQPMEVSMSDRSTGLIMTIPRHEIQHRLGRTAAPVRPLDLTTGLGRVTARIAAGLHSEQDTLTARQFDAVSERLVDLLCMLILGESPAAATHTDELVETVREYVRRHAHDPALTGAAIADALGWSLRQIQSVLQRAGTTPRELIMAERLRLARTRLGAPAYRHLSIARIGLDLGFGSAGSFNKAFRRHFGVTPGSVRADAMRP
ncbi:AraC family transcriptional regulator [Nocardia vaccinii]|uniref:AraC family transcriptional regulator n=1 Tax=Nocardia vaccinii TaxID=1822 RepID=UPI000ACEB4FA|nr:AraC family transcriptional regulator [Nocardia vaccinii]